MTVLAEVLIPTDAFGLGPVFDEFPDAQVEFERVVPLEKQCPTLLRVDGFNDSDVQSTLQQSDCLDVIQNLTDISNERLYVVRLTTDSSPVLEVLTETDVHILNIIGRSDSSEFRARFATHDELIEFNQHLTGKGIPVTLQRLYNSDPEHLSSISDKQREAVRLALRQGYFEIPRQCTIEELAHSVGVSDSAFSQRLRRGISACVRMCLDEQ